LHPYKKVGDKAPNQRRDTRHQDRCKDAAGLQLPILAYPTSFSKCGKEPTRIPVTSTIRTYLIFEV
jgi:hypothetical protein